jgi:hypothetical protein
MLNYQAIGPDEVGDFLIGYPTPGAPHVFTAAGSASNEQAALAECARRNEAQVVERRVTIVRAASIILLDRER